MQHKLGRLNGLLAKEIGAVINQELNDPRLAKAIISVQRVDTAPNMSNAIVYITVLCDFQNSEVVLEILNGATGFIRSLISKSHALSSCPKIHFRVDTEGEESSRLENIFESIQPDQSGL